jgi:beta-phosphoglucomutase
MPRAIIFDFDGVIADTEWLHFETFREVLAEEGIPIDERDHMERFLGINDRAGFEKALREAGRAAPPLRVAELVERKSARYSRRLEEVRPYPGVPEILEGLAPRVALAIASGGRAVEIEQVLARHRLRGCFRALATADHVQSSKPAPDVFLAALAALRGSSPDLAALDPAGCLAIEDSLPGIQAARAAGMPCLAVAHTYPVERLGEADRVVARIGDLTASELLAGAGLVFPAS